jgi:hypothetical protein
MVESSEDAQRAAAKDAQRAAAFATAQTRLQEFFVGKGYPPVEAEKLVNRALGSARKYGTADTLKLELKNDLGELRVPGIQDFNVGELTDEATASIDDLLPAMF